MSALFLRPSLLPAPERPMTTRRSSLIPPRPTPRSRRAGFGNLEPVDVAIVAESTYPYLKGGVSAVVHQIIESHPDTTFGIIHFTWNSESPHEDLYDTPANVRWVAPIYFSMQEYPDDFLTLGVSQLPRRAQARAALVEQLFSALDALLDGDPEPMLEVYDIGFNPLTRTCPLWTILGTSEFLAAAEARWGHLELSVSNLFWLCREFFSLAFAVAAVEFPRAAVYHAHTTGHAALAAALAARQHGTRCFLTEHNLYVRDTVNTQIERSLALPVPIDLWRAEPDLSIADRAWCAWFLEMSRIIYSEAEVITYLYPDALQEAEAMGAPLAKARIVPNGIDPHDFSDAAAAQLARDQQRGRPAFKLTYAARVVPIKGLLELLDAVAAVRQLPTPPFVLDVLGPDAEMPWYTEQCLARCTELGLDDIVTFRGVQNLRLEFQHSDLLILPSYNEGQPIAVMEAMSVGLPIIGTNVGGMRQLVEDPLESRSGEMLGACGLIIEPGDIEALASAIQRVLQNGEMYAEFRENGIKRIDGVFHLTDAMSHYRTIYRQLVGAVQDTWHDELERVRAYTGRRGTAVLARLAG